MFYKNVLVQNDKTKKNLDEPHDTPGLSFKDEDEVFAEL